MSEISIFIVPEAENAEDTVCFVPVAFTVAPSASDSFGIAALPGVSWPVTVRILLPLMFPLFVLFTKFATVRLASRFYPPPVGIFNVQSAPTEPLVVGWSHPCAT